MSRSGEKQDIGEDQEEWRKAKLQLGYNVLRKITKKEAEIKDKKDFYLERNTVFSICH